MLTDRLSPLPESSFPTDVFPSTEAVARAAFAQLAPLLAARRSMRPWEPVHGRYSDRSRALTKRLPGQPVALPLYQHRRTRLLGLDFDARHHGRDAVERDVRQCLAWIGECGGRAISDRSTSGGRHVIVPLPIGTVLTKAEVEPIVRLLAERLVTLDITPMCNDLTGALTPPGSRCKEGGFRQLDGALDDATNALVVRSEPGFVGRLVELLGGARITPKVGSAQAFTGARATCTSRAVQTSAPSVSGSRASESARLWEGTGDDARLRTEYRRRTVMPATVTAFAVRGVAPPDRRWRTRNGRLDRSAARQSVLTAAVLQGMSLTDVQAQFPAAGGTWIGLAGAYARYGRGAGTALRRDWDSACRWASANAPEFLSAAHKSSEHTGGWWGNHRVRPKTQTRWLATAIAWVDTQWPGSSRRANVLAVLQALAYASVVGGEIVAGVPVVELGGRSLSLMAGSIPETTVWQVLRDIRDLPGAPLLRVRRGAGLLADRYALVTARVDGRRPQPSHTQTTLARVEPVHPAWSILGIHHRRLYEVIVHQGITKPTDVLAAARISRSTGYNTIATLAIAGLITHSRNTIGPGPTSLDDIAHAHALDHARSERIARHQHERKIWTCWLAARFDTTPVAELPDPVLSEPWDTHDTEDYLDSVLAAGPPTFS
ncbi:hypothetical protein ACIHDR_47060 [Nocardia sp. NPDC052278]|uniref:hypothetical protein n=1 Tax=unclassified Nocardia TaxID=2637762 RepID=UPI0036AFDA08